MKKSTYDKLDAVYEILELIKTIFNTAIPGAFLAVIIIAILKMI